MNHLNNLRQRFKQIEAELKTLKGKPAYEAKKYELLKTYEEIQQFHSKNLFWEDTPKMEHATA